MTHTLISLWPTLKNLFLLSFLLFSFHSPLYISLNFYMMCLLFVCLLSLFFLSLSLSVCLSVFLSLSLSIYIYILLFSLLLSISIPRLLLCFLSLCVYFYFISMLLFLTLSFPILACYFSLSQSFFCLFLSLKVFVFVIACFSCQRTNIRISQCRAKQNKNWMHI
jgi:hypothetical protein